MTRFVPGVVLAVLLPPTTGYLFPPPSLSLFVAQIEPLSFNHRPPTTLNLSSRFGQVSTLEAKTAALKKQLQQKELQMDNLIQKGHKENVGSLPSRPPASSSSPKERRPPHPTPERNMNGGTARRAFIVAGEQPYFAS